MKKILVTGALGQIGSELVMKITRNLWHMKCYCNRY